MKFAPAFFLLIPLAVAGQTLETSSATTDQDSVRSYYIRNFPDYFFLYPVLKQRSLNFELDNADGATVAFRPNNSYSFGLGMYLFELGVELTFAVPLDEKSIARYGESRARDVQLNVLGKKWGADLFYQKYTGFYVTDTETEVASDDPFPQRSDIVSRNIGITGNYVFNHQKFSFRSAYNFAERQLFSKGSLVGFSSLSSFSLAADSSIVTAAQRALFEKDVSFMKLRYTSFSVAPGYTYSLIFNNFFLNGTLSVGPAHHWIRYQKEGGPTETETTLNSFIAARIGIGYNGERLFGGISFFTQGSNVKIEGARFANNNGTFKILIGYRFNEFGFLRRRVWDLVPFKI